MSALDGSRGSVLFALPVQPKHRRRRGLKRRADLPSLRRFFRGKAWHETSLAVRNRAGWRCQLCRRRDGDTIVMTANGSWRELLIGNQWFSNRGEPIPPPPPDAAFRIWTVWLGTAHFDHRLDNNDDRNLKAMCQRCLLAHHRKYHRQQRWIKARARFAVGDLFRGGYAEILLPSSMPRNW
jgi:hypothetical protein